MPSRLRTALRAETGPVIYVDNGDLFGGPAGLRFSLHRGPCATVQWMNDLGLAAMNLGNHDLDQGVEGLLERARQAAFPVLCANLYDGERPLLPDRVEVKTPNGPVGIAGACTAVARDMWPPSLRQRLRLTDPVTALRAACAALHLHCDVVIAMAHLGFSIGPEPAVENPGEALVEALAADAGDGRPLADVVVLGHTHVPHASVRGRTAVLSPPSAGRGMGRAVLSESGVSAECVSLPADTGVRVELVPLLEETLDVEGETLGHQLLAAARLVDADGLVVTRRLEPGGEPVRNLGQALSRAPLLEPLVLLELDPSGLAAVIATRDQHAAAAETSPDPQVARRHQWHAFELLLPPQRDAAKGSLRLLVPASWSGGYAGYDPFRKARKLAEPGLHLIQLLLVASRSGDI